MLVYLLEPGGCGRNLLDKDQLGLAERLWLASRSDLVVGMPSVAWPPYIYANSRGGFSGPLDDFATLIAGRLGLTVRYKTYPYYAGAQQALLDGEVDMLIGVSIHQDGVDGISSAGMG